MIIDNAGENLVPVRLMRLDALALVEPDHTGKASDLPILLERLLDGQPLLGG